MSIVFKDFGTAYLAAPLAVGGLTITVDNPAALPILTNGDYFYLVLQKYGDRSYVEIVKVTATAGSTYTIQRGQAGTSVRAFAVGDYAELRLTVDGLTEYITQNIATKMDKSGGGDFTGLYRFLNPSTSRVDIVRTSDDVAASFVVDFSASDGHRTIVGGTTGANVATPSILLRPNGYGNGVGQVKIDSAGLVDVVGLTVRGEQGTDEGSVVQYGHLVNYVPTARKVNGHALSADVTLSASDVKAAPEGFGLGDVQAYTVMDLDSDPLTWNGGKMGWIRATSSSGGRPEGQAGVGLLYRYQLGASSVVHILFFGHNNKMYTRFWSGTTWSAWKAAFDSTNKPAISDVVGLSDALVQAGGNPVLSTAWVQLRSAMWNGYVASDGQTLNRADYPDAWAAIAAGKVPVVSDADWWADPLKRGSFTTGDGTTTFRVPDYNGKSAGSLGAAFFRGDGLNSAVINGLFQGDAIREIEGMINLQSAGVTGNHIGVSSFSGAFAPSGRGVTLKATSTTIVDNQDTGANFKASRVVPTAAENRPVSVTGCWAVKLFGAVQNAGSIDAAGLATQIASVESRVSSLEQRKSTCLVNATGTGAPHETVVTQLPANIATNSRYVLPNPFGNNTPVICWAEVFANGKWSRTGFIFVGSSAMGFGTGASYVQGEGIVVQTGGEALLARSVAAGGGHGIATSSVTSAPCRVFVRKLEA